MQVRLAFVLGWFASYLTRRPSTIPESLSLETHLLREEIQAAREAVDSLGEARRSCEWEVWSQRWLLRIGGLVDLILIFWIVWARFPLKQSDYPKLRPVVADTFESSSDTDEGLPALETLPPRQRGGSRGKGLVGKNRPTRPSDLKALRSA